MATDLQNESISASYGSLLHLANDNTGLASAIQTLYDGSGTASPLKMGTGGIDVAGTLSASGNVYAESSVGIGTDTPNKTLTVKGSISATDEINVRAGDGIYLYSPQHVNGYRIRANISDVNDYGVMIEKADGTDLMNIRPDGQIALNHANPLNQLHIAVSGTDGHDGILITREDSTTEDGDLLGGIAFDSTDGNEPSSILQGSAFIAAYAAENHSTGDKGGDLVFGASKIDDNDDSTSHEYMRITSEGWIGIGDTTPDAPFEVEHTKTSSETHSYGSRLGFTDNGQDSSFYGLTIDYNISPDSGWTYSADRTKRGILVDVDSTNQPTTSGSGGGERLYGIDSNVNVTHDPEYLRGCMSNLWIQASAGTIHEATAGYNYLRSIGDNTTTGAYSNINQLLVASGTNTATYTSYNRTILGSSTYGAGTVGNAYGVYSEIEMNKIGATDSALTNAYVYSANLDCNNSLQPSGTSYLYYGAVQDSGGATNNYGVYISNEDKNYFSGNVGIGTGPSEKLEVAGNILLDADNAKLRLESGATGTTGFVEWGFTSSTIAYASAGIDYDTRASKGFQIGTRNYPMTIQANGGFDFLEDETTILTVDSNNVTLKNAGDANEGGELRFEPGTNYSEQYNLDSAANLFRIHSSGTVRCGVSGNNFFVGPQAESQTFGDIVTLFVSAGEADGHGPNVLAESAYSEGHGFTAYNSNNIDNSANGLSYANTYTQAFAASGSALMYCRSDSTLNASRGNSGEQGRWIAGQLSNSGPNYDGTGSSEASLGRTYYIGHQYSTNGGSTYSNGRALKFTDAGNLIPAADDIQDLGISDHRWDDVYATNSTIQTSDRTLKENISASTLGLDFIKDLNPVSYKWKDYSTTETIQREYGDILAPNPPLSAETVTEHRTFSRTHYGLIAQEVKTALDTANVPTSAFAGYIDPSIGGKEGNLGLRYSEFIAPMIKAIQEQQTIIDSLSTRIVALESA